MFKGLFIQDKLTVQRLLLKKGINKGLHLRDLPVRLLFEAIYTLGFYNITWE